MGCGGSRRLGAARRADETRKRPLSFSRVGNRDAAEREERALLSAVSRCAHARWVELSPRQRLRAAITLHAWSGAG